MLNKDLNLYTLEHRARNVCAVSGLYPSKAAAITGKLTGGYFDHFIFVVVFNKKAYYLPGPASQIWGFDAYRCYKWQ